MGRRSETLSIFLALASLLCLCTAADGFALPAVLGAGLHTAGATGLRGGGLWAREGGALPGSSVRLRGGCRDSWRMEDISVRSWSARAALRPSPEQLTFTSSYVSATGQPRSFSNWLIPGKVMLGRYPSGTPFGSKTGSPKREEGFEHIHKVMAEGITTFVCLQEEVPPQEDDELWPEDGVVPLPDPEKQAKYPQGFIRYYHDCLKVAQELKNPMPHFVHLPIPDFSTPDMGQMVAVLEKLAEGVRGGKGGLYVHCWGGRGRAGTIGACLYMMLNGAKEFGKSPEEAATEALDVVQMGYDTRIGEDGGGNKSPETQGQREFVYAFAKQYLSGSERG